MSVKIEIRCGEVALHAELDLSETAQRIAASLPLEGRVQRWGEEIYFEIPVELTESDDARAEMQIGELGYWPPGNAFCIFFGRTPASTAEEPRAASPVNPFGRVVGDATVLSAVPQSTPIVVDLA